MLLDEKEIELIIKPKNREYYEQVCNRTLKNGEKIIIKQKYVNKTSRTIIECACDFCDKHFFKKIGDIRSENTFCSKECRHENFKLINPNPSKEKITVRCEVCNVEFPVHESKYKNQEHFLCSRECYKKHRSLVYKGENIYNYQNMKVDCEYCGNEFKIVQFDIESRNHLFCSQECYWNHRKEHYTEFYYKNDLNESRNETLPEKLVREWLDKNNCSYTQEFGFMKKYFIDFYLYDYKIFLEVYGDYWHSNPKFYGNDENLKPLNKQQLQQKEYDIKRIKEIESYGYKVFIIWENEVYENIDLYMGKIIDNFNKNPQRLHAKPL